MPSGTARRPSWLKAPPRSCRVVSVMVVASVPRHELHVTVVHADTGKLIRDLELDPDRDYPP